MFTTLIYADTTTDLTPNGPTRIVRPSMDRKSRSMRLLCWLLTGRDPSDKIPSVRDGIKVEARTSKIAIRRTLMPGGSPEVSVQVLGEDWRRVSSEAELWAWLAPRPGWTWAKRREGEEIPAWTDRCQETWRLVQPGVSGVGSPAWWMRLSESAGKGRDLVKALLRVVDSAEAIREIITSDPSYREGDPLDTKKAEALRTAANSARETAVGALEAARRTLAGMAPVAMPGEGEVYCAKEAVSAGKAWDDYQERQEHLKARGRWLAAVAALGDEPARVSDEALALARRAVSSTDREGEGHTVAVGADVRLREAADAHEAAHKLVRLARERVDSMFRMEPMFQAPEVRAYEDEVRLLEAAGLALERTRGDFDRYKPAEPEAACPVDGVGVCPIVAERHAAEVKALRERTDAAIKSAERYHEEQCAALDKALAALEAAKTEAARILDEAERALPAAKQLMDEAEASAEVARKALEDLQDQVRTRGRWSDSMRLLGAEPADLPAIPRPEVDPVTPEALAAARVVLDTAKRAEAQASYATGERERAQAEVTAREAALERATTEATRLDSLVMAIRGAPAQILSYAVAALGDLGPVAIQPDGQGCRVLVGGHPWQEASTGELVHADLCLRLALRRALDCPWIPIWVDNVQDWSGAWPEVERASVWLVTTPPKP